MNRPQKSSATSASIPKTASAFAGFLSACGDELERLRRQSLERGLLTIDVSQSPFLHVDGKSFINWSSNDYLGLSGHPRLVQAAKRALDSFGVGGRASRLLTGTTAWHARLEETLADYFGAEAALVFASGYLANLGAIGALCGKGDTVYLDRLCHASLIDAVRASQAALRVFRHNDADHLRALLSRRRSGRTLVVTEGVFSMDGDSAPLAALLSVAEKHGAILYVDDAHGVFVRGKTGRGSLEEAGIRSDRVLHMATLGKAAGCNGGFVAGPRVLIRWLLQKARAFIYATALPASIAAAAMESLAVMRDEPQRREKLLRLSARLHAALREQRLTPLSSASHILPVRVGQAADAVQLAADLRNEGHFCPAIRPPTVPARTARLRISLTAAHSDENVRQLADALKVCRPVLP